MAKLGRVHVFPYSARTGTIAATLPGQVPHDAKISRTAQAIALGQELYAEYIGRFVGREDEVLLETDGKGHTRNYIEALCEGRDNEIVRVLITGERDGQLECVRRD